MWFSKHDGIHTEERNIGDAHFVYSDFIPSSYTGKITTDGVGVTAAVATRATKLLLQGLDITAAEYAVLAFGTSAANAVANLNVVAAAGTTGIVVGSNTNTAGTPQLVGIPSNATHFALITGVAAATQVVMVTQGI